MEIDFSEEVRKKFKDIPVGDFFVHKDVVMIKCNLNYYSNTHIGFNAVPVGINSDLMYIQANELVRIVRKVSLFA